jgi:predicted lipid-binding transport protein (Tim44 family)
MKQLIFLMLTIVACAAWAQAPAKEPAKPEPMKEAAKPGPLKEAAKPGPLKEAAKPEASKAAAASPRKSGPPRRWNEDARHCLEKSSNTEIIKCAEEFL